MIGDYTVHTKPPSDLHRYMGKRLFELRIQKGLTASELAARINVTTDHITAIERGTRRLTMGHMFRIARALNIDPEYFHEGLEDVVGLEELANHEVYLGNIYKSILLARQIVNKN